MIRWTGWGVSCFFCQAEDGIRDVAVTGVQTCALPISSGYLQMAAVIALGHHEKYDGSGYPTGLRGEHIPLEARIVAIADVYDALTSIRPYKPAWPVEEALVYMVEHAGRHFDPQLVEILSRNRDEVLSIGERFADRLAQ